MVATAVMGRAERACVDSVPLLGHQDLASEQTLLVQPHHEALDLRPRIDDGRYLVGIDIRKGSDQAGGGLQQEVTTVHDDSLGAPEFLPNKMHDGIQRAVGGLLQ